MCELEQQNHPLTCAAMQSDQIVLFFQSTHILMHAKNIAADQPSHPCFQIGAFIACFLESIMASLCSCVEFYISQL